MTEYVEVNQLLSDMGEDDPKDVALYIAEYQKADVVERSEYQKLKEKNTELEIISDDFLRRNEVLKKENKELAIKYDNAMNSVIDAREDAEKLRSKVDKAIEEINNCKVYGHTKTARLVSLPEVLEILKKSIGGSKYGN